MNLLKSIFVELIGLFVDDWGFALGVLVWVGVCALPPVRSHPEAAAGALFLGLALMTLGFVGQRAARKK